MELELFVKFVFFLIFIYSVTNGVTILRDGQVGDPRDPAKIIIGKPAKIIAVILLLVGVLAVTLMLVDLPL
ncbi:MAG TPA: hypothetical protein ENJ29_00765 [Bacteroidetes bacterium]|nr:hypothetical protein [Bacteroidota bacterium]